MNIPIRWQDLSRRFRVQGVTPAPAENVPEQSRAGGLSAAGELTAQSLALTVRIQNAHRRDEKTLHVTGPIDCRTYLVLLEAATALYRRGARCITLDLANCERIELSGLFALQSITMLYGGETPPDPEGGWAALRTLRTRGDTPGRAQVVRCIHARPAVASMLERNGFQLDSDCAEA